MARERYNNRPITVDRQATCPFLLRVFVKHGSHHQESDYSTSLVPTANEYQLYTWKDSSVKELILLLRDAAPTLRASQFGRFSIKFVYFDPNRERYSFKDFSSISARDLTDTRSNPRFERTLDQANFVVGDYIDISYVANPGPSDNRSFNNQNNGPSGNYNQNQNRNDRNGGFSGRGGRMGGNDRGGRNEGSNFGGRGGDYNRAGNFGGRNNDRNDRSNGRDNWAPAPHLINKSATNTAETSNAGAPGAWGRNPVNNNSSNSDRRGRDDDKGRRRRNDSRSLSPRRRSRSRSRDRVDKGRD